MTFPKRNFGDFSMLDIADYAKIGKQNFYDRKNGDRNITAKYKAKIKEFYINKIKQLESIVKDLEN